MNAGRGTLVACRKSLPGRRFPLAGGPRTRPRPVRRPAIWRSPPGPEFLDDLGVGTPLQPADEEAAILVDAGEAVVFEVAQIEQQQPPLQPGAVAELAAFVSAFVGEVEPVKRAVGDVVDEVELRAGILVMGGWIRVGQQIVQSKDRRVVHDQVAEAGQFVGHRVGRRHFFEGLVDEFPEELGEGRREPIVETRRAGGGGRRRRSGRSV